MAWASGIQLHGGWAVVLAVVLTLAAFPSHAITLSYGYDANGNRITGDGKYFEYNDANRLVRIRQGNASGPILAEFFYDHTGQRIKKIENGVRTYYIGKHFEAKQSGSGTVNTNYYFAGTERVAKTDTISGSSTLFFYHANHLGSTEAISDANGNLVNRTNYFPFGEIRQGGTEKYSFTGKERDVVSGQYYFEARYYDSFIKHFTQADVVDPDYYDPQDFNKYSYVINNPIKYIDKDGHSARGFATELLKGGSSFAGIFGNAFIASYSIFKGNFLEGASSTVDSLDSFNESRKHFLAAALNVNRDNDISSEDIPDTDLFATNLWKSIKFSNNLYSAGSLINVKSYKSFKFLKDYKYLGKDINKTFLFVKNANQYYSLLEKYIQSEKYVRKLREKYDRNLRSK